MARKFLIPLAIFCFSGGQEALSDNGFLLDEAPVSVKETRDFAAPLDHVEERIKKTFGLYITPQTSPVQPDRFYGIHTGVDWEVFPEELEREMPVAAICSGTLAIKKRANGYGGVAVQRCAFEGAPVTVIYGHLRLASVLFEPGQEIAIGETIGFLGAHLSEETDGTRKHLHLAVHRGENIKLNGYISQRKDLTEWLDPLSLF